MKTGMLVGEGDFLFICDADLSMPIEEIAKFLPPQQEPGGYDVAIASREIEGAVRYNEPSYRHLMGRVFNFVVRRLIIPGIEDTQCGFKMFTRTASAQVFPHQTIDGWGFDPEVLYISRCRGLRVIEVPITGTTWQKAASILWSTRSRWCGKSCASGATGCAASTRRLRVQWSKPPLPASNCGLLESQRAQFNRMVVHARGERMTSLPASQICTALATKWATSGASRLCCQMNSSPKTTPAKLAPRMPHNPCGLCSSPKMRLKPTISQAVGSRARARR